MYTTSFTPIPNAVPDAMLDDKLVTPTLSVAVGAVQETVVVVDAVVYSVIADGQLTSTGDSWSMMWKMKCEC